MPPHAKQKPQIPGQGELDIAIQMGEPGVGQDVSAVGLRYALDVLRPRERTDVPYVPDYVQESHLCALTEGSGVSDHLADLLVGGVGLNEPITKVPSRAPVQNSSRKKHRTWRGGGRSAVWGPSGLDVARMIAEQAPGNGLTPEQQRETNARGIALVRAALGEAVGEITAPSTSEAKRWSPKPEQRQKLLFVFGDSRAGFTPRSDGELNLAVATVPYLNPGSGADVLGRHIIAMRARLERSLVRGGMTNEEASAKAASRVLELRGRAERYAEGSLEALGALKGLQDALSDVSSDQTGQPVGLTLMQLCGDWPELLTGAVSLVHRSLVRRIATEGELPLNANPLRVHAAGLDEIVQMISNGEFPKTKTGSMARYIADQLQATAALSAHDAVHRARLDESRRMQFWMRVQDAMPQDRQTDQQG